MAIAVSILAVLVALAAFLVSLYQLLTRHRPFIWVNDLKMEVSEYIDSFGEVYVKIGVVNRGEVPGKRLRFRAEVFRLPDREHMLSTSWKSMGAVFPDQALETTVGLGLHEELWDTEYGLNVAIKIWLKYQGPVRIERYGAYETYQPLYVTLEGEWGNQDSGKDQADFH